MVDPGAQFVGFDEQPGSSGIGVDGASDMRPDVQRVFRTGGAGYSWFPRVPASNPLESRQGDHDFRISALERNNCVLRAVPIDLHAHVESQKGAAARSIEDAIWKELAKSTEPRDESQRPSSELFTTIVDRQVKGLKLWLRRSSGPSYGCGKNASS